MKTFLLLRWVAFFGGLTVVVACGGGGGGSGGGNAMTPMMGDGAMPGEGAAPNPPGTILTAFGDGAGAVWRNAEAMVDGTSAIVTVVALKGLEAFTRGPNNSLLLQGDAITFGGDAVTIKPGTSATATLKGGQLYRSIAGNESLSVYINDSVVIGYSQAGVEDPEVVVVGARYSGMPSGEHNYDGFASVARSNPSANNAVVAYGDFSVKVNFDRPMAEIAEFRVRLGSAGNHGTVTARNLDIDTTSGAFRGALELGAGTLGNAAAINMDDANGVIYGQLHGAGGTALSGGFHNSDTTAAGRVIGGFVGARSGK